MNFILACVVCEVLFIVLMQIKPCKKLGFLLLIPSFGLMIATAFYFYRYPTIDVSTNVAYGLIGSCAFVFVCLILHITKLHGEKSIVNRFKQQISFAALTPLLSIIVATILTIAEIGGGVASLVCLSGAVFGSIAVLISINLILISFFEYETTRNSIKTINKHIKSKQLVFVRISVAKDVALVASKTVLSMVALSFFMFANALYSAGLGVARFYALRMHRQSGVEQIKSYFYVGGVIFLSSVFYVIYSIRLFGGGETGEYPMVVAISIACYTFFEFGINIKEAFRLRKSDALEAKALRAISLSSTLLSFVLTQTAIMSFASSGDNSYTDALSGVFFGTIAAFVGVYVMIKSILLKRSLS